MVGDVYELPFKSGYFDAVVLFDLLEHLEEPQTAVAEINRVLKSGGIFHFYCPCEGGVFSYTRWIGFAWHAKEKYAGHVQRFTAEKLIAICGGSGFVFKVKRWSGHLFYQLFDAGFFTFLWLRGKNVSSALESMVEVERQKITNRLLSLVLKVFALCIYIESTILGAIPGQGAHFLMVKASKSGRAKKWSRKS